MGKVLMDAVERRVLPILGSHLIIAEIGQKNGVLPDMVGDAPVPADESDDTVVPVNDDSPATQTQDQPVD
jgi:hypothetical protein